jgi:PAS domain S-box-containing protein
MNANTDNLLFMDETSAPPPQTSCLSKISCDMAAFRAAPKELNARNEIGMMQIFNAAVGGMRVIDRDLNITMVNDAYLKLSGFTREELVGAKCHEHFGGVACNTGNCTMLRMLRGEPQVTTTLPRIKKDGTQIYCDISATPFFSPTGELIGIIEDFRDITERRFAEERLAEAKLEFQGIFENSQVGIMLVNGDQMLAQANQRLANILGYDAPGELVGLNVRALHVNEDSAQEFKAAFYSRLIEGEQLQIEYLLRRKDGTPVWCMLSGKAVNPLNLDRGVIWCIDDLSHRKTMESELMDAKEKADAANQSKSIFLATMSHEIRTPMTAILGFSGLALQMDISGQLRDLLSKIKVSGEHLLGIINDVLDLAKLDAGKIELESRPFSTGLVIQEIADILAGHAHENGNEHI